MSDNLTPAGPEKKSLLRGYPLLLVLVGLALCFGFAVYKSFHKGELPVNPNNPARVAQVFERKETNIVSPAVAPTPTPPSQLSRVGEASTARPTIANEPARARASSLRPLAEVSPLGSPEQASASSSEYEVMQREARASEAMRRAEARSRAMQVLGDSPDPRPRRSRTAVAHRRYRRYQSAGEKGQVKKGKRGNG